MQPKYRRRRQLAAALAVALITLLVGVTAYVFYVREVRGNRDYEGSGTGDVIMVRVEDGDSVSALAPMLVDEHIVGSRKALINQAEKTNASLMAGYYPLRKEMSAEAALKTLTDEKQRQGVVDVPTGATLDDVRVVGGQTRPGIFTLISQQTCKDPGTCVTPEKLRDAVAQTPAAELGVPQWAQAAVNARGADPRRIEGLISPGIHVFNPQLDAKEIVKDVVTDSAQTYEDTGLEQAAAQVKLKPYEMITAASLVEREAPSGDFDKVARVILNRLDVKQRLEFDSTVNYAIDEQEVATTNQDRERVTPWNTYAKQGLPDTPISSPGLAALKAVENPAPGDWLYFVTVDKNGTTVFNKDFADHQRAVAQSQSNGVLDSAR
ncbi:endolytic transglycosylase MltG [Corynebacterium heidelbergense]|uniref:Endolytic murein transglycosylase n=1 Tax=Corynebacterium heidelbergense TaxID=2055947 RepID=A0A364VDA5_9CORY|nr:endolytic transglycosylase MltG [Corynebacterium heidelbergense]RAV34610.1 endolytic transglycosylase MltG [Corynebacterium heidelbergense]WCZ36615.1 putative aminodeoxychorismate lyase [Corynebacterium heidelbergense]